jgi:hypothetical protein
LQHVAPLDFEFLFYTEPYNPDIFQATDCPRADWMATLKLYFTKAGLFF